MTGPVGHRRTSATSRPRPTTVRSTTVGSPPRAARSGRTARSVASTARPSAREVALQLEVADEDVLVDEGQPEVAPGTAPRYVWTLGWWSVTSLGGRRRRAGRGRPGPGARLPVAGAANCARTASVSAPSGRASGGTRPGVRDSFGAMPGTSSGRSSRGSSTATIISRARTCGSAAMSAMLLIRLTGI